MFSLRCLKVTKDFRQKLKENTEMLFDQILLPKDSAFD